MKVLMITRKVDLEDPELGFIHTWVKKLSSKVEILYVVALDGRGKKELPSNIKIFSMGKEKKDGKLSKLLSFNREIVKIIRDIDIIFCHMSPIFTIIAAPYSKIFKKPIVTWYTHKNVDIKLRIAHIFASRVVTASKESFRIDSNKVRIIGHGIDTERFSPEMENKRSIISIGRISPIKNYETLIDAANIIINKMGIKDIEFKITGMVPIRSQMNYLYSLNERINRYNLERYFKINDPVPHNVIHKSYQDGAIFVNLSNTDSVDKAILEAMACENIVLTSNIAFKDVFQDFGEYLIFPKKDYKELANRILWALNLNHVEKINIKRRLREIVVNNHNIDNLIDSLIGVFNEVIKIK